MVLEDIVKHQREALTRQRPAGYQAQLRAQSEAHTRRDFKAAILAGPAPALIAECKRRSPVRGVLLKDYDPARQAQAYARGGASAISVLTSPDFDGSMGHLSEARAAVALPLLCKDFVVDPVQVLEAGAAGSDCVLLIARVVAAGKLAELAGAARELGLQTLIEVFNEEEVESALQAGPDLVGVNSRDLDTFEVNASILDRVAPLLPAGIPLVAESGVQSRADVLAAGASGARAVLVGETLMRAADPAAKAAELLGVR